jgi:putative oxidoreductase
MAPGGGNGVGERRRVAGAPVARKRAAGYDRNFWLVGPVDPETGASIMATALHRSDLEPRHRHDTRPLIDRVAADWGNALWLLGRILIGGIFVQSGLAKLMDIGGFTALLTASGLPEPAAAVLALIGAALEFAGGLAVVLGFATRYAALGMVAFVIAATLISHRFWSLPPAERDAQMIQFAKNVAIIGGFLFVFVTGGGRYSLDRWWRHAD